MMPSNPVVICARILIAVLIGNFGPAPAPAAPVDQIQLVNGSLDNITAGVDGTLYSVSGPSVARIHPQSGETLKRLSLDFRCTAIAIDRDGSVWLLGITGNPNYPITPGAYERPVKGRVGTVIAKYDSSLAVLKYATVIGGSGDTYGFLNAIAVAPDGSISVTGSTYSTDFPVTPDAFQPYKRSSPGYTDAFFVRLTADLSKLLYSTYLGGATPAYANNGIQRGTVGSALAIDANGDAIIAGTAVTDDFPTTAGALTASTELRRLYTARWNSESHRFEYIALIGIVGDLEVFIATDSDGRAVIAGSRGIMPGTAGALHPEIFRSPFVVKLNESGSRLIYATALNSIDESASARIKFFALDEAENIIILSVLSTMPATVGASALPSSTRSAVITKLDSSGRRLLYSTYIKDASFFAGSAAYKSGIIFVGDPTGAYMPSALIPVSSAPPADDRRSVIFAMPNTSSPCYDFGNPAETRSLYWDTRDQSVEAVEVHLDSPGGQLIGTGLSGAARVIPQDGSTYFLQNVTRGLPLTSQNTLAVERVSVRRPAHCSAVAEPDGLLTASPNPVLTCVGDPYTGSKTTLVGIPSRSRPDDSLVVEIHVLAADGPLFSRGRLSDGLRDTTGDWISNGTDFFLVRPTVNGSRVLASERVYVLPIRSCQTSVPTPPAIAANPPTVKVCGQSTVSTLAWYAGTQSVEIRQDSETGPTLARFDDVQGLFDVSPVDTRTYYLMEYDAGNWHPMTSVTVRADRTGCNP